MKFAIKSECVLQN